MKKNYFLIMIVLALCSCQKEISQAVLNSEEVDVYVAGFVGDSFNPSWSPNNERPTYWKNGTPVQLNYDEFFPDMEKSARALSIAVSGNNVYVAGYQIRLSYTRGFVPAGTLWKNGIPLDRDSMNLYSTYLLSSLAVSDNDLYMVGWGTGNDGYWKNENQIALPPYSTTTSITVSGNDVYVAGASSNGGWSDVFATYWKNGNPVKLTNGSKNANATSIAVSGSDVYVAGSDKDSVAKYWKNGTLINLTDGLTRGFAEAIAVSGSDVYVAGTKWDAISIGNGNPNAIAIYWKNGNPVNLTDGSKWAEAKSIAVSGNDVYVAGFEGGVAKYWKNGSPVILGDASRYSEAHSVFIVKH